MLRAYRFQLRCKPAQERALAEQKARYARGEKFASYVDMAKWLTAWRNAPETAWLSEGPIHPQQQALRRLEEAFKRFFAKAGGYPSFKRRGQEPGIRFPDPKQFALDQSNGSGGRAKLNEALRASLKDPEFIKRQEALGISVVTDARAEPEGDRKFVEAETSRWAKVIQADGAYAD